MKELPGFFIGIIILVLVALTGTSAITASVESANARDFHASVVAQIEASEYNPEVIASLSREAKQKGYTLVPIVVQTVSQNRKSAEVLLKYQYRIGIFSLTKEEHEIRGYAR